MAVNVPYTTHGVCYVQLNRAECDGTPLTVADGDNNVIILGTAGDASELELSQEYQTQAAQQDGACWTSPETKTKSGATATLRWCSKTYHDVINLLGLWAPLFTPGGLINGYAGEDYGSGTCCLCQTSACTSHGFSVISYSCPMDCSGTQITDAGGNLLWEVTVLPWVVDVSEVQPRRRSQTPSSNRVDYTFRLDENENYGTGPGGVFALDAIYEADGLTPLVTDAMVFLTSTSPPTADCPCSDEAARSIGEYVTAASIVAGNPAPLGDEE